MSIKNIIATLAITATVTQAEKMRLSELMNLQSEMVSELDFNNTDSVNEE